ncbi:MAG: peptidoglycan D,D-transpeptidase FtsI family protein [Candidatus Methylomirabilales bacterium]
MAAVAYRPPRVRVALVLCLITLAFAGIASRLFALQIRDHRVIQAQARRQYQRRIPVAAKRGTIFDRQGRALALSLETASVFVHPGLVENPSAVAGRLGAVLRVPPTQILQRISVDKPFVWIERKIEPDQVEAIARLNLPGVGLVPESKRYYPKKELAAHLLGFVGVDDKGLEGVELRNNRLLGGGTRWVISEVDALGRIVFRKAGDPDPAADLYLTIDEVIQHVAERELAQAVHRSKARAGSVIVMDPRTGALLALANLPTYNPNRSGEFPAFARRNRAVTDTYEPGSAFKLVLAAGALEDRVIRPKDLIYGEGGAIELAGIRIRDHEEHGWMTFRDVLAYSSNVGAIKVSMKLGKERFYGYITDFGFGLRTGIDLPGEVPGLIRRPMEWSRLSIGSLAIGQEIAVTSLQLLTAVAAVANGGTLMRPYVLQATQRSGSREMRETAPVPLRRVVSSETAQVLTAMMVETVERGTGREARIPGYRVAGKTGTAQKLDPETGRYSHSKLIASFVGFVPAESPRLAILVLIDEPRKFRWGGTVAAPAFREIAREALTYFHIPAARSIRAMPVAWGSRESVARVD